MMDGKFLVYGFNLVYKNIVFVCLKGVNESMFDIHLRTISKGVLPHLSYIFHNMEPLGT